MNMQIPSWVPDAVFYQIFPERFRNGDEANDPPRRRDWNDVPSRENFFGGDLAGIVDGLDYIAQMGFNALYLNPIFEAGSNHKYDTHDYFKVDPSFGDDASFERLIQEAHAQGIRVVLDGVFNHCGLKFAPFQDVRANGESSRYVNWFDVYDYPVKTEPIPNYATCGGAHYLPRLNAADPEVERFISRVALHWLDRGIDGWRLDVPYEIHPDFWRRFRRTVKEHSPEAYLVAEEWRDPVPYLHGDTFDGVTHYRLREIGFDYIIKNALTGEAFGRALDALRQRLPEGSEFGMLTLLGSHDTPRLLTECGGDTRKASLLQTMMLTLPGAPLVYYGDENGMEGGNDPDCRRPMKWEEDAWRHEIRAPLLRLLELRNRFPVLRRGSVRIAFANDRICSYYRELGGERVLVVINNSALSRNINVPCDFSDGSVLIDLLRHDQQTMGLRRELENQVSETNCYDVRSGHVFQFNVAPHSALLLAPLDS